jgi:flagellar protein FlaG
MYIDTLKFAAKPSDAIGLSDAAAAKAVAEERAAEPVKQPAPQQAPVAQVKAAAEQIESYLRSNGRALEFRVDGDTGRLVVTVRDPATGDTIRQIPSEEALAVARSLGSSGEATAALLNLSV